MSDDDQLLEHMRLLSVCMSLSVVDVDVDCDSGVGAREGGCRGWGWGRWVRGRGGGVEDICMYT